MHLLTLSGAAVEIDNDAMAGLAAGLRGDLITEGAEYDEARVVFNGMFDRRPGAIVRCRGAADVVETVNFARKHDLLLAIRAGGHSIPGHSSNQGGFVLDLSDMRGVWVDRRTSTVRVEGGATWGDVDRQTQLFGLAVPGGVVSTTGVAGLTLNGGLGYLRSKYGFSCDNLVSADVVTADGRIVTASAADDADLFWAIRGGGGNFGVVTSFEFRAHPVGPDVAAAIVFYPVSSAKSVLSKWRELAPRLPDEVSTGAVLWTMPTTPHLPPPVHGHDVVIITGIYSGNPYEGAQIMQPLRELGAPLFDMSGTLAWLTLQSAFDFFFPVDGSVSAYFKSMQLNELSDDAIEVLMASFQARVSKDTLINMPYLGRGVTGVPLSAMAFAGRDGPFMVSFDAIWPTNHAFDANVAWARESWSGLEPFSTGGVYLNFSGDSEPTTELVSGAFGSNYARLVEAKTKYDPENLFRLNQNIKPAR
jgi:FAD/FMN-containing dehydrogenase